MPTSNAGLTIKETTLTKDHRQTIIFNRKRKTVLNQQNHNSEMSHSKNSKLLQESNSDKVNSINDKLFHVDTCKFLDNFFFKYVEKFNVNGTPSTRLKNSKTQAFMPDFQKILFMLIMTSLISIIPFSLWRQTLSLQ